MGKERYETGLKMRRKVLGEDYVAQNLGTADSFNKAFQEVVTEFAWGGAWSREGLDLKTRSLIVMSVLTALGRGHEFKLHFRGAINNGATLEELREALIQVSLYAGMPAGVEGFRLGREVLNDMGITPDPAE
jgi:4-carboxymuconolactone decarboxylase